MESGDRADRARHGRGHGYLPPRGGPRPRQEDRRGNARYDPDQRGRTAGVSRRGAGRGVTYGHTVTIETLPALLLDRAQADGRRIAMREKEYGIWQSYTWAECLGRVQALALGFARLGAGRGDRLVIVGDNRPELYWSLLAAQALGTVPVPVYQDTTAAELRYAIVHAGARIVIAEDQ